MADDAKPEPVPFPVEVTVNGVRIRDDLRYSKIPEPLVVCRNNVPWRVLSARFFYGVFVSIQIVRPKLTLGIVAFADLPLPRWILEPLLKTGQLFRD
jgi:hypothetical protein